MTRATPSTDRVNTTAEHDQPLDRSLPYDGMTGFAAPHLSEYAETRNDLSG